jgi:hypothetical protein
MMRLPPIAGAFEVSIRDTHLRTRTPPVSVPQQEALADLRLSASVAGPRPNARRAARTALPPLLGGTAPTPQRALQGPDLFSRNDRA